MTSNWRWLPNSLGMLAVDDVLPNALCQAILAKHPEWYEEAASIHRDADTTVDQAVRSTRVLTPPKETKHEIQQCLTNLVPQLQDHFAVDLERVEKAQVLRYGVGDKFRKHRDGSADPETKGQLFRKVSLVLAISETNAYAGGDFVIFPESIDLHGRGCVVRIPSGGLLAFRADLQHEVTEVTNGERFSVVSWAR